ncbi:hypothetical protein EYF80_042633 [Liparis tanakae]|uniref:Uncharacterized protein n=1 Tax=Liparis tanakae TaxID=230148 RepID=A0A4Z2G1N9_9TELE|nr:hypothetical protein EYF80_042633 [Liparis tanakae]
MPTTQRPEEAPTISQPVVTVQQIFADASRVLPRAQRRLDALDDAAQVPRPALVTCNSHQAFDPRGPPVPRQTQVSLMQQKCDSCQLLPIKYM